ncbi:MAG: hypothetical protein ACOCXR_01135 [Phototrophicaceae bacterium]
MLNKHLDIKRHWCPRSETYTGCDSLMAALNDGWGIFHTATVNEHRLARRVVTVYMFTLYRDAQLLTMRVVESPYLHRVIAHYGIEVARPGAQPTVRLSTVVDDNDAAAFAHPAEELLKPAISNA